jgi:nitrilase
MPTIRLATASPATQPTLKETLAQLASIARRAATPSASNPQPADILLLPEAYLGGYPRGSTFGAAVGGRTAEGRNEYLEYFKNAVDLGDIVGEAGAGAGDAWVKREIGGKRNVAGPGHSHDEHVRGDGTREELERIARETGVFLVVGLVERAGGSLYCAAVYVCPNKGIIGKRRKVMPVSSATVNRILPSPQRMKHIN